MSRLRIAAACLFAVSMLAFPLGSAHAASPSTSMIGKINKVRAKHGLRPLRRAPSLNRSARRYARVMMARDYFGHAGRINAPRRFHRLGEAIAYRRGRRARASRTLRSWLNSPGHRALVLSSSFRYVGAGVTKGNFRGRSATIWVLHLGAR